MGLTITIGEDAAEIEGAVLPRHLGKGNQIRLAHWGARALVERGARFFDVHENSTFTASLEDAEALDRAATRYAAQPGRDIMREDHLASMRWAAAHIRRALSHNEKARVVVD